MKFCFKSFTICLLFITNCIAIEVKVFDFTEIELSQLEVRKVRGADNKTVYSTGTNENGNHNHSGTTNQTQINHRHSIQGNTQQGGSHTHSIQIGNTGSNPTSGIDNRPPYYVLCYIMKA